jgi:hypothetical protein
MTPITPYHYLVLSAALFCDRRCRRHGAPQHHHRADVDRADAERREHQPGAFLVPAAQRGGQVFAIFIVAVAAAEAAVGLGIILAFFRNKETREHRRQ